jgi:hypothetical protein
MSSKLRGRLKLDIGDWLLFDTKQGNISLMVSSGTSEDTVEFGEYRAVVNDDCPIIHEEVGEVQVQEHNLTIGADVEFFMVEKNTGDLIEGKALFDYEGEVGSDGDLCELRPNYSISPERVTENIDQLIKEMYRRTAKTGNIRALATSWYRGLCCGFHMHFGLPPEIITFAADKSGEFMKNLIHAMDYFVGIIAHSIDTDDKRRLSDNYGKPGDYRISMRTLEYRVPGGYHLRTRRHTNSMLCLGFSVMDEIVNECKEISNGWSDMSLITDFNFLMDRFNIPSYEHICNVMRSNNKDDLLLEREKVAQVLTNFKSDYINDVVLSSATNTDLMEGWI